MPDRHDPPSAPRILCLGLLAWAAYVGLRGFLRALLPAHDWPSYLEQDLSITAARLGLGLFCLWLGRLRYDAGTYWNRPGRLSLAWILAPTLVMAHAIAWSGNAPQPWDLSRAWVRGIEAAVALVVAFNEEVGFRATLFEPLRERWGRWSALAVSSLLFTLMHFGYQPWTSLLNIALTGLALGLGRLAGLSLGQLIAIHFAIDAANALYLPSPGAFVWQRDALADLVLGLSCLGLWKAAKDRQKA